MRAAILAVLAACGRGSSTPPPADYDYAFQVYLTGTSDNIPGASYEYDYRSDGECMGRRVDGTPFTPHKQRATGSVPDAMLAPAPDLAVGVIVRSNGRDLARGCEHAMLAKGRLSPITVELR